MKWLFFFSLILTCLFACENQSRNATFQQADNGKIKQIVSNKSLNQYTKNEIWKLYLSNPCYLPLLKDSSFWEKGTPIGFNFEDLFNDSLPAAHPFRNRYLVADLNSLFPNAQIKGVKEVYPELNKLYEFEGLDPVLVQRMQNTVPETPEFEILKKDLLKIGDSKKVAALTNFLNKIWTYKMIPIVREYSIENDNIYAAGQSIVMCEACKDTLKMVGRFATSAKRQDIGLKKNANNESVKYYYEYLPIQNRRRYYAGLYRITSKNWETQRAYDSMDIERDKEVGGGNTRITFYQGTVELPNFLLLQPDKRYPHSMLSNGIHEVALRGLARGMLGTANSIGCLRVSDFGSKFLRWWVPQNCKVFVSYNDSLYHNKVAFKDSAIKFLPFKSEKEGNLFRKWLNTYKPRAAKILEISETGDYRNGYIIDGYYYFKDEYQSFLSKNKK